MSPLPSQTINGLSRRKFIKLSLLSAGAMVLNNTLGCTDDDTTPGHTNNKWTGADFVQPAKVWPMRQAREHFCILAQTPPVSSSKETSAA